ncbi:cytochrome c biogenesis CcdA family protein [Salinibacterium soli]|uniref:Cytochrome c biogenesis protein CcdA n=1 Tax=Antiquaquibacter soli TaxID=3064523 RepID=A0ABT9BK99_9MICO|nr:cytochrome c biogenesis protein CcdA [Protaetiibacter sp. WY-16]MDO7880867.1 cytochrome c biogenesis protein CcdA [Protaetiibacter sp. WY-16]
MGPGELVSQGSLAVALPIALAAGLLAFLSPCVLPLVPGYLGYVSGVTDGGDARRSRTVLGAALFVLGFSIVFLGVVVLGSTVGVFLLQWGGVIERVAGAIVILMGLVFIGQVTFLQRTIKPRWQPATGLAGAPLLGAVFAIGWTPCIGPTLVAVTSLASYQGDPGRALVVGLFYCLGLGIPFVLVALGLGWVSGSVAWVKKHIRLINIVGGALLVVIGVLMVTGLWGLAMSELGAVIGGFLPAL